MSVAILLVPIILLIFYYIFWRKRWMTILERNGIKGPKPHLIYGNLEEINKNSTLKCVEKWEKEYGQIFGYYNGGRPTVVVTDPQLLKQILIQDFRFFRDRHHPREFTTHSIPELAISSLARKKGNEWKELRTLLRSAFSVAKLRRLIPDMSSAIESFIEIIDLKCEANETDFDIFPPFQGLTLDVIGRTAFGVRANVQKNPNDPFLKSITHVLKGSSGYLFAKPILLFPEFTSFLYTIRVYCYKVYNLLFMSPYKYFVDSIKFIVAERRNKKIGRTDFLQSMIDGKIKAKMANEIDYNALSIISNFESVEYEKEEMGDRSLTDNEVISNTILFFEAGFETTSTSLAFIAHILVNYLDVQEKVRQEVIELLNKEGNLDYNTLNQLPFMEAVIYETLRLHSPITLFVTRTSETDYKYENITIPKGTAVVCPTHQIHHNPNFWEDPEKFDPYRFYGENKINTSYLFWQPFGAGPRNCIGMRFAMLEMKMTLAKLLLKYRLEPGPRTEIGHISYFLPVFFYKPKHVYVRCVPVATNETN